MSYYCLSLQHTFTWQRHSELCIKVMLNQQGMIHPRTNCSARTYTFVVNYGQNKELPVYNDEQPGCTYYYSPLSVYNLGVVNHAHDYGNGMIAAHMHCHIYHKGIAKKEANNVASLIMKTLWQLNVLCDNSMCKELNIIFDNCSGQNKIIQF